jgi:hypothetical protein
VLALDEVGDIFHGARSVKGVHGMRSSRPWVQLTQVFLHAWRLKLEGTDGLPCWYSGRELVVDRDVVQIHNVTRSLFTTLQGLLQL